MNLRNRKSTITDTNILKIFRLEKNKNKIERNEERQFECKSARALKSDRCCWISLSL